jgi:hypothetical protein
MPRAYQVQRSTLPISGEWFTCFVSLRFIGMIVRDASLKNDAFRLSGKTLKSILVPTPTTAPLGGVVAVLTSRTFSAGFCLLRLRLNSKSSAEHLPERIRRPTIRQNAIDAERATSFRDPQAHPVAKFYTTQHWFPKSIDANELYRRTA